MDYCYFRCGFRRLASANYYIVEVFPGAMIEYRHPELADIEEIVDVLNRSSRELRMHRDETAEEL